MKCRQRNIQNPYADIVIGNISWKRVLFGIFGVVVLTACFSFLCINIKYTILYDSVLNISTYGNTQIGACTVESRIDFDFLNQDVKFIIPKQYSTEETISAKINEIEYVGNSTIIKVSFPDMTSKISNKSIKCKIIISNNSFLMWLHKNIYQLE